MKWGDDEEKAMQSQQQRLWAERIRKMVAEGKYGHWLDSLKTPQRKSVEAFAKAFHLTKAD